MPAKSSQRNTRRATYSRDRLRMSIPPLHDPQHDEDKIRAAWRRDVFGIPTRFDQWLEREVERGLTSSLPPRTGNVRCALTVSFEEGAVSADGRWQDCDIYRLHIQVLATSDLDNGRAASPRAVYCRFEGSPNALSAPPWVQWPTNTERAVWYDLGCISSLFVLLAMMHDALSEPGLSVAMIKWAQLASIGTNFEAAVRKRAGRYGFPSYP
ncbi:hypothetical protein BC629DRAFT_1597927 [Irpex lacteus]|nr:hypothetical protein BC629DRAFT_1597927 [Irpex lacteus]